MLERSTAEREMMHRFKRIENFSRWFPVSQISFPCVFGKLWHAWVTLDFITEVNGWPAPAEQSAHQAHSDLSLKHSIKKLPISNKQNEEKLYIFIFLCSFSTFKLQKLWRDFTFFHVFFGDTFFRIKIALFVRIEIWSFVRFPTYESMNESTIAFTFKKPTDPQVFFPIK